MAENIGSRLNIRRKSCGPGIVVLVNESIIPPDSVLVHGFFSILEELKVVELDLGNVTCIRCQPGCDWALVRVEPW